MQDSFVASGEEALLLGQLMHGEHHLKLGQAGHQVVVAQDEASRYIALLNTTDGDLDILSWLGALESLRLRIDAHHLKSHLAWHEEHGLADGKRARLDLAHDNGKTAVLEGVDNRNSEGSISLAFHRCEAVQEGEHRGTIVPWAHLRGCVNEHIRTGVPRDGDELNVLLHVVASRLKEGRELVHTFVEAVLAPSHGGVVHLVDNHDQVLDTNRLDETCVFSRLSTLVEPSLELTLARGYDENGNISLCCSTNHVGNVVLVPRSVQDGVSLSLCFKVSASHLDCLTLCTFFLIGIYNTMLLKETKK